MRRVKRLFEAFSGALMDSTINTGCGAFRDLRNRAESCGGPRLTGITGLTGDFASTTDEAGTPIFN
jgi:hypothetical protein